MTGQPIPILKSALAGPPDATPLAPVNTRIQLLPFEALSWENFERLCHRLTAIRGDVEYCARFGRQGEAQEGIDIYARQADGRYHCLQAKRHQSFDARKLRDAINLFLAGDWADKTDHFTITVQALLRSRTLQAEIERQAARLKARGITFTALDGEQLTDELRQQPVLIDDFFGRAWVTALLGPDAAAVLDQRLDGPSVIRVRAQLARIYEAQFQFVDPGSFGSINDEDRRPALTLLERFVKSDFLVRETGRPLERADTGNQTAASGSASDLSLSSTADNIRSGNVSTHSRTRRLSTTEWLADGDRLVVLGEAGSGKSTLLRVMALDLLRGQSHFPEVAARWGNHIPLYIPFARWTSQVARHGHTIGVKEIVRSSLEQVLTTPIADLLDRAIDDRRVLLLVDGLDEWSSEQAARTTLGALVTTIEAHSIPAIVSGRPRGLSRIGALPSAWKRGAIAPLSVAQQAMIARQWFGRYGSGRSDAAGEAQSTLRTGRFMAELARDTNLGALATVPLLLIGLVTLALRGQILPRTKSDVYDQLVRVLLEIHPDSRATASGDTEPRFRHATDPDQRRAAIARLAFATREQTGGGSMVVSTARDILRTYLSSSQGFELAEADAAAAANEILAVNSETQGLIVEKAQGEVGFVHASFEEFLGAEYVAGWPFAEIEKFVAGHAGDGRWRNVISNLLGRVSRRDEFDRLVALIETAQGDELALFHRHALLGDIAFEGSSRSPATSRRLVNATMERVELQDWMPARREALSSVLRGLGDSAHKAEVDARLSRWLPARVAYRSSVIGELAEWQPTAQVEEVLWQALHDEDHAVQRAAAAAYAQAFGKCSLACDRLIDGLEHTRDLSVAAAMVESLALAWAAVPRTTALFEEAARSLGPELRLAGILGLAKQGCITSEMRDTTLHSHRFWSDVSYPHRQLAAAMLLKYWPNDDQLIEGAIARLGDNFNSFWEPGTATAYLLQSSVDRADVRKWILAELAREFPFVVLNGGQIWFQVGRFANADPNIRAAVTAYWSQAKNRLINMYKLPHFVAQVADPDMAKILIGILGGKSGIDRHWALKALISGWTLDHPDVGDTIHTLAAADDQSLADLVALLPAIMPDKNAVRERLLRMSARPDVRLDLLAIGLSECGCDGTDEEAVTAILARPEGLTGVYDAAPHLFRRFASHAQVRALALARLDQAEAPLSAIAEGYPNDPEFAPRLFDAVRPLPVELRTQVLEVAATGASGTPLEAVLNHPMLESDPELRARMVIARCSGLPAEGRADAEKDLLAHALTVGSDYDSARAAALAGLATIGALGALEQLKDRGKPVALETGGLASPIPSVERVICEKFADFEAAFGDTLGQRLNARARGNQVAAILSAAPGASPAARARFLEFAEKGEIPRTPQALRSLAIERPRSALLLARCWETLDSRDYANDRAMVNGAVGQILRDNFRDDGAVLDGLVARYKRSRAVASALPLAIFAPDHECLDFPVQFADRRDFADWTLAAILGARRATGVDLCALLEQMVTRSRRTDFDGQIYANEAVAARLRSDPELQQLLSLRIAMATHPSVSGSFARYLAAAGKFGTEARAQAIDLSSTLRAKQRVPVAGYDAISDEWRALRSTLLDAAMAGLELT